MMENEDVIGPRGSYGKLYLSGYRVLTRARKTVSMLKRKALGSIRAARLLRKSDREAFEKIVTLIPNLSLYNDSSVRRLNDRALSKGFKGLAEYHAYLLDHGEEFANLKENLTFVGSHFFRGEVWPELRRCIRAYLVPRLKSHGIKVWCAGCSSGKEVYSLLMTLLDYVPAEMIDVLASDYNDEVLERCAEGVYPLTEIYEIPERFRGYTERYLDAVAPRGAILPLLQRFRFKEQLRSKVKTSHVNLLTDGYPRGFDIVFCRNVIKFFNDETIVQVQRKLSDTLVPGGILVVSEDAHEQIEDPDSLGLERVGESCIYRKLA